MKYRKKPIVIEAVQWQGYNLDEVLGLVSMSPLRVALSTVAIPTDAPDCLDINTMEGTLRASPGDWIIKGVKGEFYPCKPDIFEATYKREEGEVSDEEIIEIDEDGIVHAPRKGGSRDEYARCVSIIQDWLARYPEDIFPPPPAGQHGQTVDACSARAARHVLREVLKDLQAPPKAEGAEGKWQ